MTPLMTVKGQSVTLLGWRTLTPVNVLVLFGLACAALLGLFLGFWLSVFWWFLCGGASLVFAYGLWVTVESTKTRILFAGGSFAIDGERIEAAGHGPFYFTTDEAADGVDDRSGGHTLWLKSNDGDAIFVTMMSLHADTDTIGRCLNNLLDQCKAD